MQRSNKFYAERAIMALKMALTESDNDYRLACVERANTMWSHMVGECNALTCALLDIEVGLLHLSKMRNQKRRNKAAKIAVEIKQVVEIFRDMATA